MHEKYYCLFLAEWPFAIWGCYNMKKLLSALLASHLWWMQHFKRIYLLEMTLNMSFKELLGNILRELFLTHGADPVC